MWPNTPIIDSFTLSLLVFTSVLLFTVWLLLGRFRYDYLAKKAWEAIEDKIKEANKRAETIIEQAKKEWEIDWKRILMRYEQDWQEILRRAKTRLEEAEEEKRKNEQKYEKLKQKEEELSKLIEETEKKLEQVANLTREEAREQLFSFIKKENEEELRQFIEKIRQDKEENAKKEAAKVLVKILPRVAIEWVNNFLVTMVELPSDDLKWKLIWREWRNIAFFEKLTWVEMLMDDTPGYVKLSSFDAEKRFIAKETLEKLIKDARINPFYIEKYYNESVEEFEEKMKDIWKKTLIDLWLTIMKPEILSYIWKFSLRYWFWQNLLQHSIEVAQMSALIAAELGYDTMLAKKAGLLHDIWKIDVTGWDSHTAVGWDILRKFGMNEVIVNTAESHHFDKEIIHPIWRIVAAADAISASREWARNNTKDKFIERMSELEKLIKESQWVEKVYIMQAGREIRWFVNSKEVDDLKMAELSKEITSRIEKQLDYPGIIRVTLFRETHSISYVQ